MNYYSYEAIDGTGQTISGEIQSASLGQATVDLESRGLVVQTIRLVDPDQYAAIELERIRQRQGQQALENCRAWAAPLEALSTEASMPAVKRNLGRAAAVLESAKSLSEVAESPVTGPLMPVVLQDLSRVSQRLDAWLVGATRRIQQQRMRREGFFYPLNVALFGLAVMVLASVFIIPGFRDMYEEFGISMPAPTLLVLNVSSLFYPHFARTFLGILILGPILYLVVRLWRSHAVTTRLLPWLTSGTVAQLEAMSTVSHTVAELMELGTTAQDALLIASKTTKHAVLREAVEDFAASVSVAGNVASLSTCSGRLPPMFRKCFSLQDRTCIEMLRAIGDIYGMRAYRQSHTMQGLIAPVAVLFVGLLVGFVLIALFMPLVSLVTSLA